MSRRPATSPRRFKDKYNEKWLVERHRYRSPGQFTRDEDETRTVARALRSVPLNLVRYSYTSVAVYNYRPFPFRSAMTTKIMDKKTLFIFVDESDNFDFSSNGTKYFVLTGVCTLDPLAAIGDFAQIKYDLLRSGKDIESFHATNDKQFVRDRVFAEIKNLADIEVHSVIAEKRKAHPSLYLSSDLQMQSDGSKGRKIKPKRVEERFYKQVCETLLQYIIRRFLEYKREDVKNIVVILDKLFHANKREFVTKHIKQYMSNQFKIVPYIYFHQMKSDINCQICDYCCWAIFAKWSRNEMRPYNEIKSRIVSEFDLFKRGYIQYY